jgi:hypothetical protein
MKELIFTISLMIFTVTFSFAQWGPDVRLTDYPCPGKATSENNAHCIAANGNTLHVVWEDERVGGPTEIFYKRSSDGGSNWGADTRLSTLSAYSYMPTVAVSGQLVFLIWDVNERYLYFKRSTDGGLNWGSDIYLTTYTNSNANAYPSMTASGQTIHVVWVDSRNGYNVYYKRSTDGGLSWNADTQLSSNSLSTQSPYQSVCVNGQVVHAVWSSNNSGSYQVYYKRSTDNGLSWSTDTILTSNTDASLIYPSASVTGQNVHIVWNDDRDGNQEIYYKHSTDAGISWGSDTRLTFNAANSYYSFVTASGSNIHVTWDDNRDGSIEYLYYKHSTDGGISWSSDMRLTFDPPYSFDQSMEISGSTVHMVWTDWRYGSSGDIFYKRNPGNSLPCSNPPVVNAGSDTTIYYGYGVQNAVLTASVTSGTSPYSYHWSTGATSSSITVSPTTTTSYNVLLTDANSCTSADTVVVSVIDVRCGHDSDKVLVCHNGNTLCISAHAVPAHLAQGDYLGDCSENSKNGNVVNNIPDVFKLYTNYPNPFNPSTKITFDLPEDAYTKLIIYDLTGREVTRLVDNSLKAGRYEFEWNANNYASGIYFYKIQSGKYLEVKKMVLLK